MASPEDIQQFEMIVNSLMSQDNALRGQAEQAFNAAKANPDALMSALIHLLRNNQNEAVRARMARPPCATCGTMLRSPVLLRATAHCYCYGLLLASARTYTRACTTAWTVMLPCGTVANALGHRCLWRGCHRNMRLRSCRLHVPAFVSSDLLLPPQYLPPAHDGTA